MTSGEAVIANDPSRDPRRGGLPEGHPALQSFLGLPFFKGEELIGMAGISNRPGGYDEELVRRLAPFQSTCANIIEACRTDLARRKAEAARRESEERFKIISDLVSDYAYSFVVEPDGTMRGDWLSESFVRVFGYTLVEIDARGGWASLVWPEDMPVAVQHAQQVLGGERHACEMRFVMCTGETRWIHDHATPVWDEDQRRVVRIIGAAQDITERKRDEEELRLREREWESLMRNTPAIILKADCEGKILFLNRTVSGFTVQDSVGKSVYDFTPPEHHQTMREAIELALETNETVELETQGAGPDGAVVWYSTRVGPITNDARCKAVILIATDITMRMRAEEALRTSEAQFRNALEIARAGHWEYDVGSDRFTFNDNFYRIFRTTAEQVGGYEMSSADYAHRFCHPDDRAVVGREVQAAIEATEPGYGRELAHRILYADGKIGHLAVRFFVVKDDKGRTVKTYGVNQDITERTRAAQQVKLFRTLMDHSNDAIEVLDARTLRFTDVNDRACRDLGFSRDEILSLTIGDIDPGHSAERAKGIWEELRRSGSVVLETRHRRKDGSTFPVEVSIGFVKLDRPYLLTVARDVTERKRAERHHQEVLGQLRQAQKMDALGRLAGGVAHDFNNLLAVINNYAAFLLDDLEEEDPRHDDAAEILKAGDRAASLTKQLLAFSRQEVIEPRRLSVHQVVGELEQMLRRMIGEDIDLRVQLDAPRIQILASPGAMDQVLINLAVNARDAMPDGGRLSIRVREMARGESPGQVKVLGTGRCLELSVTDTGSGMSPEVLEHVFEPFYTTKQEGRGTGLGLATVYGIVKQLGGEVRIQSTVGVGTTVRVLLPAISGSSTEYPRLARRPWNREQPVSVLLVEDEEQVRRMTARILRGQGIVVHEASDGAEALTVAAGLASPFDLLITDVIMPNLAGPAVVRELRRKLPGLPVLFISGYAQHESLTELLEDPTVGFLAKPFSPDKLISKLCELLGLTS